MKLRGANLCVLVLITVALTDCGSSTNPGTGGNDVPNDGPSGLTVEGNAAGWDDGDAFVRAIASNRTVTEMLALGSLRSSGEFTITLPSEPFLASFGPLSCVETETGELVSTPNSLVVAIVRSFGTILSDNGEGDDLGEVAFAKGDLAGIAGATRGTYVYARTSGTIVGSCISQDGITIDTFDLDLQAGWNRAEAVFEVTADTKYTTTYRSEDLPSDLRWQYAPYPRSPNDGPARP